MYGKCMGRLPGRRKVDKAGSTNGEEEAESGHQRKYLS